MPKTYRHEIFEYRPSREQLTGTTGRSPVIVVGAGPVGLTTAVALAKDGVGVVLLDDNSRVCDGSRAICFAKRSLEVFDRLGVVGPMRAKGISWNVGRVLHREREVYSFNLLPEGGHAHPAFINLQQYYVEQYLIDSLLTLPAAEIRWLNKVIGVESAGDAVRLTVETPDGPYRIEGDYVIAADGARSAVRQMLGLRWEGVSFPDKFLIVDVHMKADFPRERWFWFDPPFNPGRSFLRHPQPDDVWRLDFQLGPEADMEETKKLENVIPRVKVALGEDAKFEIEWISVYSFESRMLDAFRHGRVFFAGDAAHLMSVFGARGANSGVQDADNLCWKLKLVLEGKAPQTLLDSYDAERVYAARKNLAFTESSTRFISPGSASVRALRDSVLELAAEYPFARSLINTGRLSTATVLLDSPLNTPDQESFEGPMQPGAACADAPVMIGNNRTWLLGQLGNSFTAILFADASGSLSVDTLSKLRELSHGEIPVKTYIATQSDYPEAVFEDFTVLADADRLLHKRYDGRLGTFYLIRPDQHVCARWRAFDAGKVKAALARACCL